MEDVMELFDRETEETMSVLFRKIDTDRSGYIEYSELVTAGMERQMQLSTQSLTMAFETLADDRGYITTKRFYKAFSDVKAASEEDISMEPIWDEFLNKFDENGDNMIDKVEFFNGMGKVIKAEIKNVVAPSLNNVGSEGSNTCSRS